MEKFDYIVVGSGAAGSVLASRLSADGRTNVLLIEAGKDLVPGHEPADIRSVFPLSYFNRDYMWDDTIVHWRERSTSPAAFLQQGRILGGSSQLMGMWAMRGHPQDFAEWTADGVEGWSWEDVLPFFRLLETDIDFHGPEHGCEGPLPIRRERPEERVPFARAVHDVLKDRGYPDIADMNADFRDGHCTLPVSREENSRASAGTHYLDAAARARSNLHVMAESLVERIDFEEGRAVGVTYRNALQGGGRARAPTTILACGALRSPMLLLKSGIGPAEDLARAGVACVRDLPGVGVGLQNHALIHVIAMLSDRGLDPAGVRPAGSTVLRWSSGEAETPPADMAMYIRSGLSWHALGRRMASLAPCIMRPASRGRISLQPDGRPLIEFNMLSDPRDLPRLKAGMKMAVEIYERLERRGICGPPMLMTDSSGLVRYNVRTRLNAVRSAAAAALLRFAPAIGQAVLDRIVRMRSASEVVADDDLLTAFLLEAISGMGHVCGTCRMGDGRDRRSVVDPRGRVHGVPGLLVADASIMPTVPAANTHIPTVMVAEKIAAGLVHDRACVA